MELRDLRYFVLVAEELHFARAAQRLFISQPALSQQIRSLEDEIGFKLLERNSRGVKLTAEGRAFLTEAETVVHAADHATEVARALAEGATGYLRLSHLRTMPRGLPERVVSEYQRRYPGIEINPESGSTEQNVDRVRNAQVDVAFVLGPVTQTPELGYVPVANEPFVVAVPSAHALSRRRRIRREELMHEPLVWYPATTARASMTAASHRSTVRPYPTSSGWSRMRSACWSLSQKVPASRCFWRAAR